MKGRILLGKMQSYLAISLIGYIFSFVVTGPVLAEVKTEGKESTTDIQLPATNVSGLLSQSSTPQPTPSSKVVQVTGVKANPTTKGLELILQTTLGEKLQITNRSQGNNFIADIPNAQLRLVSGEGFTFRSEKPLAGITEISVMNFDGNTIRVTVVGEASLPTIELFDSDEGLIFGVASATQQGQQPQQNPTPPGALPGRGEGSKPSAQGDEPIELVVTGEQDGYRVPNATSATRTDTPIRDIPASIQVIPQEVIRDQQITSLEESVRNVSGVTVGGSASGRRVQLNVRGFDGAPTLRDGFRQYGSFQVTPEVAGLEQIEVLKGPASILYGEVQPGGVINLVSKKPLSSPFYEAELQVGNRGLVRPSIDISGPLTSDGSLLYRLNGLYQRNDSVKNYDQENRRLFLAPSLAWKISDRTDLNLSLEYLDNKLPADFGAPVIGNRVANIPRDRNIGQPDDAIQNQFLSVGYNLEHRFNQDWKLRNAFRYSSYNYDFNVIPLPLSFTESTGTINPVFAYQEGENQNYSLQTNLVGNFATGFIKHTLLFGVDYNHTDEKIVSFLDFTRAIPFNIFNPVYGQFTKPSKESIPGFGGNNVASNRVGIYLQDQISLSENLKLLAGLRYDTIEQKTVRIPGTATQPGESTQNDDAFIPRFGIVYQPSKDISLYASYSQSFTPNTGTTSSGTTLQPEKGEGYEFGVKTDFFAGKLAATLSYFDITKQNVAVADPNFPLFSVATGEQRSRGVEFDLAGEILPGWKVIGSYAYIDAEVTKDSNANNVGKELFGTPNHSASLWTTYEIQKGNLQGLGLGLGFNYVGERQGDLANSFQVDSYVTTNAAIFYRRDNWRFALNFKNIGDVTYIESVTNSRSSGNYFGDPFTVIGSISVQF